jgi:hypothetical protein
MALVKHNNNSISDITTPGSLTQGKMTLISSQTASGSASIEFTSGIDSSYPIYQFEFINCHPATDDTSFQVGFRDGATNYDATKTTTAFFANHAEDDSLTSLVYYSAIDQAQSTSFQSLSGGVGNGNDECISGTLQIFNPSSTTFVKHFISNTNLYVHSNRSSNVYVAGYCNTTSAIDGVQFKFASGNIDSGTIKLYGIGE